MPCLLGEPGTEWVCAVAVTGEREQYARQVVPSRGGQGCAGSLADAMQLRSCAALREAAALSGSGVSGRASARPLAVRAH